MIPKYLYHYTNVKALKDILLSSKIRFKRLDLLNDPYEGLIFMETIPRNKEFYRKLIYCACFTAQTEESVNLWAVYTNMEGVRIKQKTNMFADSLNLMEHDDGFVPYGNLFNNLKYSIRIDDKTFDMTINRVFGPIKIAYVRTIEETTGIVVNEAMPNLESENEIIMREYNLRELGLRKIDHWKFEDEWRYKLQFVEHINEKKDLLNCDYYVDSPEYIDLPFYNQIEEIMLGPQINEQERNDIKSFLSDNNFDIPVTESKIKIVKWK